MESRSHCHAASLQNLSWHQPLVLLRHRIVLFLLVQQFIVVTLQVIRELSRSLDRETDEGVVDASAKAIDQSGRSIDHFGEYGIP